MQYLSIKSFASPNILTGIDARLAAGGLFVGLAVSNILVVTDKNIIKQPWFTDVLESLKYHKIEYFLYDSITLNSPHNEVMLGVDIYRDNLCAGILAVGGGSVIDVAKGIGIVVANNKHILTYEGVEKVKLPVPPLICIPSTSGTASEVSQFAIIRDMDRLLKIAIISKTIVPDYALLDPEITLTMDKQVTVCTGLDALTHAVEALVSVNGSIITGYQALNAVDIIVKNFTEVLNNPNNITARNNMLTGSLIAGLAFSNAGLGAVHAMAHSLGGLYNAPHGECNALLLPFIVDFNYNNAPESYDRLVDYLGLNIKGLSQNQRKKIIVDKIFEIKNSSGINYSLTKIGMKPDDIHLLAKNAFNDACLATNPRKANIDDLKTIFSEAL